VIGRGLELAGRGTGRVAATAAALVRVPATMLVGDGATDPDVGRLGPVGFDEARHLTAPDGGNLFTVSRGTGPTLVLVHGMVMTSRVWTKQFRSLAHAGVTTVSFDHRGHGGSTPPTDAFTVEEAARDLVAVVDGLDLHDCVVVAHSTGALAAGVAAGNGGLGDRVRGLVLVGPTTRFVGVPGSRAVLVPFVRGFVESGAWSRFEWSRTAARMLFGRSPLRSQVELVRVLLASARPETVVAAAEVAAGFDLSEVVGRIHLPTLVVNGTADLLATPGDARRLVRELPDARLELVQGAGHMVMLERAEELGALVLGFARELGVAPGLAA